jgi:2-iminobutanoate/2-iminopropanoate deaminase
MTKIIRTNKAPAALGPYSQAVVANNFIFCSGQIGINPKTGNLAEGIGEQTKQALQNLNEVLIAAGANPDSVVKTTIYLKNMEDFTIVNTIYANFFKDHKPARATVEISSLPKEALIEIEAIAHIA